MILTGIILLGLRTEGALVETEREYSQIPEWCVIHLQFIIDYYSMISISGGQLNALGQFMGFPENLGSSSQYSVEAGLGDGELNSRTKSLSMTEYNAVNQNKLFMQQVLDSKESKSVQQRKQDASRQLTYPFVFQELKGEEKLYVGLKQSISTESNKNRLSQKGMISLDTDKKGVNEVGAVTGVKKDIELGNSEEPVLAKVLGQFIEKIGKWKQEQKRVEVEAEMGQLIELIEGTRREIQKLEQQNLSYALKLDLATQQLQEAQKKNNQKGQIILNLQRLHRQLTLEREELIFQNYNLNQRRNQQSNISLSKCEQTSNLKTIVNKRIKPCKSKEFKSSNQTIQVETFSHAQHSQKYEEDDHLLAGIEKSETLGVRTEYKHKEMEELGQETIQNQRKESESEISHDFFFEIDKDRTVDILKQRIDELEFDLKIKDETLNAINTFINQNIIDMEVQGNSQIVDILKKQGIKQKLSSSLKLAEENAYLKKCMEKLSESDVFWLKFENPGEKEQKQSPEHNCLLF